MITIQVWENPFYNPLYPKEAPQWMAQVQGHVRSSDTMLEAIATTLRGAGLSTPSAIAEP